MSPPLKRVRSALVLTAAFLAVCRAESTEPSGPVAPKLVIVAQPATTDTVDSTPSQALVIEVRGVDGKPKPHVVVRFTALPSTDPMRRAQPTVSVANVTSSTYFPFVADSSDARGRVSVLVRFGVIAGATGIEMNVPELAILDTFALTVRPGAPAFAQFAVRDTLVSIGARYNVGASTTDRYRNPVAPEPVTFTAGSPILSVDATGNVTAAATGRGYVVARMRSFTDTLRVSIVPPGLKIVWYRATIVWMSSLDGTGASILARSTYTSTYPHAAPGGQLVAFYEGSPNDNSTISVASATEVRMVASTGGPAWPRWSADGQWIYFTTRRTDGIGVSRMHADGSSIQQIGPSFTGATFNPVGISPDGQTVVVQNGTTLALIDVTSGALRPLSISCGWPQFSPDGSRIACVTASAVLVINADGSNQRVLASRAIQVLGGVDWSPDGAWLLISGPTAPELVSVVDGSSTVLTKLGGLGNLTQAAFVP